mmetsp:Transcript_30191/g.69208  ORF Transcript_30191/g.69208 Transcript_30191/m.69208 type:complete len:515 (-) Transcript_30191:189-1733(-)|eukprot:CAMPEP_0113311022 /NCGR_PEP_ID=MMETSP0010_2-20120614/8432_1 /TAXON_ID=216773 ORGANISM="Corethron hystrix, Strain 308" /NCGR_SAMPLE_ID=MMETSP0010_2 /ASSEMBLY_ACC=CAM_ASM_000155 /LENGTH=514 /DNA_ID=CAMNT_0000166591 /DNA_START=77 /DNA_END=1621 /DNA_ORIENTATION=+ /assembly_acc=CAM_ASM_000155
MASLSTSPVAAAFPHIQWDPLGALRLTAQETALLRMAETNPIEYTLADSRDASMYARVLLKLLAEASGAAGNGGSSGEVSRLTDPCSEDDALDALDTDPLGVVTHYAITKLHDILSMLMSGNGVTISTVFYVGKDGILVDQWKALLRVLNKGGRGDAFAQSGAALCLARILLTACPSNRKSGARQVSYSSAVEPLEALISWIVAQLKASTTSGVSLTVPSMNALMDCTESRLLFASNGGIRYLAHHLRLSGKKSGSKKPATGKKENAAAPAQLLYELAFCLWTLTYEANESHAVRVDFAKDEAVAALCDLVGIAPREKVVRVSLAALRNLAVCEEAPDAPSDGTAVTGKTYLNEMIACGLMKAIEHMKERQWTDPDIVADVQDLHSRLVENYKEMSRWEVYVNEVESGQLAWGNTHTEAFFKENAKMIEGKGGDFRLLKVLIALLSSNDEDVAAIACYDVGEFVRHYPNGRAIAKKLGAKELVMPLIENDNPELQRHALQCISKIMVQNWEYVK